MSTPWGESPQRFGTQLPGSDTDESSPFPNERRALPRRFGNGAAVIFRSSDMMRFGIEGDILDISVAGVGISMGEPLEVNEQITVLLTNLIQRVQEEVRGIVRHSMQRDDGMYHVGIELVPRLTPMLVSMLKMSSMQYSVVPS